VAFINLNTVGLKRFQEDIIALWLAVYTLPPDPETPEEVRALFPSLIKQSEYPGFTAVANIEDGKLVGLATGWPMNEGMRLNLAKSLGENCVWLKDVFLLSGLAVLPSHQGRGIARDMLGSLFSHTTCSRALLVTYISQTRAVEIYEKTGWENISMKYMALNKKYYRVMGKSLPERQ
jgi:Acetyltransferases